MAIRETLKLGEMLIEAGVITPEQLEAGLKEHKKTKEFLGVTLVKMGFVSEEELLPVLSKQLGIPFVRIKEMVIEPEIIKRVPAKFASHYKLMPLRMENGTLVIAVTDPLDIHTIDDIKLLLGYDVKPVLAGEKDITEAIKKYYGIGAGTVEKMLEKTAVEEAEGKVTEVVTEEVEELAEDASVIKFVNQLLSQAVEERATDVHIEPYEDELKVRFRIDGVLNDISVPPAIRHFASAIVSRIKIMANLNIAERRLPQDGRIIIKIKGKDYDLRISIIPCVFGESVVIRILSPGMLYSLEELGLLERDLKILEEMIAKPHGIIFNTGPTGSGKTTTLYACLSKINKPGIKIITIEDPVEYQLKGIVQLQVHPKIGFTFATGLRSILRHDPDVIMVGEVRDLETAETAIRVALTGHLVFSTLHTNDAAGGVTRLIDMGIEPFLVASSVECIIAQRLVRLICPDCKKAVKPSKDVLEELEVMENVDVDKITIFEGKGCEHCKFTGYRGRTGIYEFLVINNEIRKMIVERLPSDQIKKKAMEMGMRTLRQDGWEKVLKGLTTPAEVMRVTQREE
ncbi:MAG: type II secretion system ATPase GspE [Candidatus Omnitrophica bacterium]|nr:type II secretion system ATPase GspE [Candidatus Omnitrophota bacterium]MCM8793522.1 type II secretion system ATPase GspE [Candidatus Omnitrophota bacterium]